MNGEMAQAVTIVAHGNLFLKSGRKPAFGSNSTFQYVGHLEFARYRDPGEPHGSHVAGSVEEWLERIRSEGATRLWMIGFRWNDPATPEHIAAAFSGGTPKAVQTDFPDRYELWYPRWSAGGTGARPWSVEYRSLTRTCSYALPPQDLEGIATELGAAIQDTSAVGRQLGKDGIYWADYVEKALPLLAGTEPAVPYHPDLLPDEGYSLRARQLIAASAQASIFGGMGSWNDLGVSGPVKGEYDRVTERLYAAIKLAFIAGANSFGNGVSDADDAPGHTWQWRIRRP